MACHAKLSYIVWETLWKTNLLWFTWNLYSTRFQNYKISRYHMFQM